MLIHFLLLHALFFPLLVTSTSVIASLPQHISALRLPLPNNSRATRVGLSGEPCDNSSDCRGENACISLIGSTDISLCENSIGINCLCLPFQTEQCSSSSSTGTDECFVECNNSADCSGEAICGTLQSGVSNARGCLSTCDGDGDCLDGEVCFKLDIAPAPFCIIEEATDRLEGERVCIDAEALSHLGSEELVYEKHVRAMVPCDAGGSCATPGHMVRFRGEGMMMKSYCALVGCVRTMKHVNSPRWRRGLTVPSKTEGLEFTAFAARYETRVEEGALKFMVRMRL